MTTLTTAAPAITKRIQYSPDDHDYAAYVSIDGEPEQYLGSRPTQPQADALCDEYAYHYYTDRNTHEVAARIALAMFEPEPGPPVDDGPDDNWGGFRCSTEAPTEIVIGRMRWDERDQEFHLDPSIPAYECDRCHQYRPLHRRGNTWLCKVCDPIEVLA